jgi:hypothetical protein
LSTDVEAFGSDSSFPTNPHRYGCNMASTKHVALSMKVDYLLLLVDGSYFRVGHEQVSACYSLELKFIVHTHMWPEKTIRLEKRTFPN